MYCIKCGVQLAESEKSCPLCGTKVYHPDLPTPQGEPLYPDQKHPSRPVTVGPLPILLTVACLMAAVIVFLCDLQVYHRVSWSGYVMGALVVGYISLALPLWFQKPNPVIFIPCGFAAGGCYLLYISLYTRGGWFLSFAFPVLGGIALIVTTVVTLCYYLKKGRLYVFGGAAVALGGLMLLTEFLLNFTFAIPRFIGWSLYPLSALVIIGALLIFLAICRPARESMERKFFI